MPSEEKVVETVTDVSATIEVTREQAHLSEYGVRSI